MRCSGENSGRDFLGKVDLKIPELTRDGTMLRLTGKGVQRGNAKGDHFVQIEYDFPKKLSASDRELLGKIEKLINLGFGVQHFFYRSRDIFFGGNNFKREVISVPFVEKNIHFFKCKTLFYTKNKQSQCTCFFFFSGQN